MSNVKRDNTQLGRLCPSFSRIKNPASAVPRHTLFQRRVNVVRRWPAVETTYGDEKPTGEGDWVDDVEADLEQSGQGDVGMM